MNKQIVVYPYDGILFCNKNERITDTCYNMDEPQKSWAKWRKSGTKDYILCGGIHMKCSEKISGSLGLGMGMGD